MAAGFPKPVRRLSNRIEDLLLGSPGDRLVRTSRIRLSPGPTPVRIPQDSEGNPCNLTGRFRVYIENREVEGWDPPLPVVYIGGPDVTKERGFPIDPKQTLVLEASDNHELYAIQDGTSPQAELWTVEVA